MNKQILRYFLQFFYWATRSVSPNKINEQQNSINPPIEKVRELTAGELRREAEKYLLDNDYYFIPRDIIGNPYNFNDWTNNRHKLLHEEIKCNYGTTKTRFYEINNYKIGLQKYESYDGLTDFQSYSIWIDDEELFSIGSSLYKFIKTDKLIEFLEYIKKCEIEYKKSKRIQEESIRKSNFKL